MSRGAGTQAGAVARASTALADPEMPRDDRAGLVADEVLPRLNDEAAIFAAATKAEVPLLAWPVPGAAAAVAGPAVAAPPMARRDPAPALSAHDTRLRLFDWLAAACALAMLLPVMVVIASLVKAGDGGPVLFRHRRVGIGGVPFDCLKFRTMCRDADQRLRHVLAEDPSARAEWHETHKLRHDPRITVVGWWLRRSSLDELPQLFNVLAGSMSLVGPRPIVAAEIRRYGRHFAAYCTVRPGITGVWQAARRDDTSYRRRVACDVLYCRRRSLSFNVRIIFATVPAVLFARGAR